MTRASQLRDELQRVEKNSTPAGNDSDFDSCLQGLGRKKLSDFMTGIKTYQAVRKTLPPQRSGRVIGEFGAAKLIDYGDLESPALRGVILLIPSLVNRATIVDLSPERSFVRFLAEQGFRPLVLDWGSASDAERDFDLTDYIGKYLTAGLKQATEVNQGRPVVLLGYCMGGLLGLAAAQLYPDWVSRLILLATPWNFDHQSKLTASLQAILPLLEQLIQRQQGLSVDSLQTLFYGLDPFLVVNKFCHLGAEVTRNPQLDRGYLEAFARLEDWLNDGVPLVRGVARETLLGWYGQNSTVKGEWRIMGQAIDPARVGQKTLVVIPSRDRIVPPESALALGDSLPWARIIRPDIGHVGMMVSPRAEALVWQPLVEWLNI
ncbi:MAG: alpha/beta fold hydrolase [Candidatus Pacebacteria bacterium]|nr:alpha/beta fold hydrolase [Candidatus Paceibacterota bacterium]